MTSSAPLACRDHFEDGCGEMGHKEGSVMRAVLNPVGLGLAAVTLLFGCNHTPIVRDNTPPPASDKVPEASALVNYLNQNAARVQTVRAKIDMDCKANGQSIALG